MDRIKLKSSTNRFSHTLVKLTPLDSDTKAYRFETELAPTLLRNEKSGLLNGISFHCGPVLTVGIEDPQCHMTLKEISPTFDKASGEYLYLSLIFE